MKKPNNDPVPLFNPLAHDFKYTWYNDKNEPIELTMRSIKIMTHLSHLKLKSYLIQPGLIHWRILMIVEQQLLLEV